MRVYGSQIQTALYVSGESRWPVGADASEALAEDMLDPGPFGYIAGRCRQRVDVAAEPVGM